MNDEFLPDLGLRIGDKVIWQGAIGKVILVVPSLNYSVVVDFGGKVGNRVSSQCFRSNGLYFDWHKTPSLKKIEKIKKVEK